MAALAALGAEYNKQASESRDETDDSANGPALRDKLQAVLASEPVVSIDPFRWQTDQGESTLMVKVQLASPEGQVPAEFTLLRLGRALKYNQVDFSVSHPMTFPIGRAEGWVRVGQY